MIELKLPSADDRQLLNELLAGVGITERERAGIAEDEWEHFLLHWTDCEPERYLAILLADSEPIGLAGWDDEGNSAFVGILPEYKNSGLGLAGFEPVIATAFQHAAIDCLKAHIDAETDENLQTYLAAGFAPVSKEEGERLLLRLTRESYEARRREHLLSAAMDAMCAWDAGDPHRIQHFLKVHSFARQIALTEGVDSNTRFILETAALTHDIGIRAAIRAHGYQNGALQEQMGPPEAEKMLLQLGFPAPVVRRACFLISKHHTCKDVAGIDWQILLEADFLVNMAEKGLGEEAAAAAEAGFFRTAEGKRLLHRMIPREDACTTRPEQRRPDQMPESKAPSGQ